jgi:hypothetical protein
MNSICVWCFVRHVVCTCISVASHVAAHYCVVYLQLHQQLLLLIQALLCQTVYFFVHNLEMLPSDQLLESQATALD